MQRQIEGGANKAQTLHDDYLSAMTIQRRHLIEEIWYTSLTSKTISTHASVGWEFEKIGGPSMSQLSIVQLSVKSIKKNTIILLSYINSGFATHHLLISWANHIAIMLPNAW